MKSLIEFLKNIYNQPAFEPTYIQDAKLIEKYRRMSKVEID